MQVAIIGRGNVHQALKLLVILVIGQIALTEVVELKFRSIKHQWEELLVLKTKGNALDELQECDDIL